MPEDGDGARAGTPSPLTESVFCVAEKRSITIAGHATSIRIESPFWDALLAESAARGLPVSALVAQIDAARLAADPSPNLASALRLWLFALARQRT